MLRVVLEQNTLTDLLGCLEDLEICDESGQVMARLTPDPAYRRKVYERALANISEEEIAQARQQRGKGRTLGEILKDLEARNGTPHGHLESGRGTATHSDLAGRD